MIPWVLIVVGGVMIYAGVKGENPIEVIKSVLTTGDVTPTTTTTLNDAVSPGIQSRLGGS